MACRYEEEILAKNGDVEQCGCRECPYKNLNDCYEITFEDRLWFHQLVLQASLSTE